MRRLGLGLLGLGAAALAAWVATTPKPVAQDVLAAATAPDAKAGERIFAAAGCGSCHSADGTEALTGGQAFETAFGTFYAPNISTDPTYGIGGWNDAELINAMMAGVSPAGQHYYPAFPYTAYSKMTPQNAVDLIAYLRTLPADATPSRPHETGFPFNIRRALGGWKLLYASTDWHRPTAPNGTQMEGRYLVEALAHCAECHTPRTALGGLNQNQWMRGAPNPSGRGTIPSIHPDDLGWSAEDIEIYLETGFTPDFDTVGGSMADVVDNTAKLTPSDRRAIAAYLLALP